MGGGVWVCDRCSHEDDRDLLEAGRAVLEERFQLVLANGVYVRNAPGRKSDPNDATWIPDLMAHVISRSSDQTHERPRNRASSDYWPPRP